MPVFREKQTNMKYRNMFIFSSELVFVFLHFPVQDDKTSVWQTYDLSWAYFLNKHIFLTRSFLQFYKQLHILSVLDI